MINETNLLLATGGVMALVAATWSKLKILASRVVSLGIVSVRLEGTVARAMANLFWREFKRSPFGNRRYTSDVEFVRSRKRREHVAFELISSQPLIFWRGGRAIFLSASSSKDGDVNDYAMNLTFLRGTFDIDQLIQEAMKTLNDNRDKRDDSKSNFRVVHCAGTRGLKFGNHEVRGSAGNPGSPPTEPKDEEHRRGRRPVGVVPEDIGEPIPDQPLAALAMSAEVRRLVEDVKRWRSSQDWYEEKRIPWRFGVLLYGQPGSGKSSLVRGIAQTLNMPVYSYDLATFGNAEFVRQWEGMLSNAPCVALIEDIDAVFEGRENTTTGEDTGLTFDCLLNAISGVANANGVLLFITTNRVESLDHAIGRPNAKGISTRPGRVDRAVEMSELDEDGRRHIANRILEGKQDAIDYLVKEGEGMTGAQFEEQCARLALTAYWSEKKS